MSSWKLLKHLYGQGPEHPAWAGIARKFGWITLEQYLDAKPWPDARIVGRVEELAYRESPFLKLIKKDAQ